MGAFELQSELELSRLSEGLKAERKYGMDSVSLVWDSSS